MSRQEFKIRPGKFFKPDVQSRVSAWMEKVNMQINNIWARISAFRSLFICFYLLNVGTKNSQS